MDKKVAVIMFALVAMVGSVSVYAAEEGAAGTEVAVASVAPLTTSVSGEVVSVDLQNSLVVVKNADAIETKVVVTPETKILKDDANVSLIDVAVGSKVTIATEGDTVVSITLN